MRAPGPDRRIVDVDYEVVRAPPPHPLPTRWLEQGPVEIGPLRWATKGRMLLFFILIMPLLVLGTLIVVFGGVTWLRLRAP